MAVPTFTSITPDGGSTQGRFAAMITGTNFRQTPDPPAGYVGSAEPQTVRVTINGEEVVSIQVISETELIVSIPDYRGPAGVHPIPASDVEITNLDDSGEPIPGESVTSPGAFTYSRPQLDSESDLTRLVREVLRMSKRQILPNTVLTTHTDFDESTGDFANITAQATLPVIVLQGPAFRRNLFYSDHEPKLYPGSVDRESMESRPARTVDLVFEIMGAAEHDSVLLNLLEATERFFELNPYIYLERDPTNPSSGKVRFEMELTTDLAVETAANLGNVGHFVGTFEIRGFDVELDPERKIFEVDDLATDGELTIEIEGIGE